MLRLIDIVLSVLGIVLLFPVLIGVYIWGMFNGGAPLFFQERVGRFQKSFILVKFRTMRRDTESLASHLVDSSAITKHGKFLRNTKLDELPQLWNVLKGDMSLVGARPGLFSQEELTEERAKRGVFDFRPGITGLAQVSGIDMSTPELLAETDAKMLKELSLANYFKYILYTLIGKGTGDAVN